MKEVFRLDEAILPTLPTPHDCIIKEFKRENDFLVFVFEDNISYHDSVKYIRPNAKTLTIKYHLIDIYEIYHQRWNKIMRRLEYLELKNESKLFDTKIKIEYLNQYVTNTQLIIKLWKKKEYVLNLSVDYVEYNWIE